MNTMRVSNLRSKTDLSSSTLSADVRLPDGRSRSLWIKVQGSDIAATADSFLALCLLPAMKLRAALAIDAPVSTHLVNSGVPQIQETYRIWRDDQWHIDRPVFHPVDVSAPTTDSVVGGQGVASFFSGGVDSTFSLVEASDEITDLIFIHDWEAKFDAENAERAVTGARNIAGAFGKSLVEVQTNAKDVFGAYVSWHHYHGSVLAAIALALGPRLRKALIPSSHDLSQLFPWGSHPLLDPLWSTESLRLVHDRVDVTRLEKIRAIADYDIIMQNLRVCWDVRQNCGRCGKCTRTMFALQAIGRYKAEDAFNRPPLTARELARVDLREQQTVKYFQEVADFLIEREEHPELVKAVQMAKTGRFYSGVGILLRGDFLARLQGRLRYMRMDKLASKVQNVDS